MPAWKAQKGIDMSAQDKTFDWNIIAVPILGGIAFTCFAFGIGSMIVTDIKEDEFRRDVCQHLIDDHGTRIEDLPVRCPQVP